MIQGSTFKNYLSLVKFSHTVFALPFAMVGYFLGLKIGETGFDWFLLLKVILCMVFARNAAMGFNRYADRHFDKLNPRTLLREIPSGIISAPSALRFVIINALSFITTTYFINKLCFLLSPVALLIVLGYSFTKRFTALCHFILGVGLSLAPVGAFLAVTNSFHPVPIIIAFSVLCWVGGFDIIYALQDRDFDMRMNLNSIPVSIGHYRALLLSRLLHLLALMGLWGAGYMLHAGFWYYAGFVVFMLLLVYQHILVKPHDLSKVDIAFFTTNGIASLLFFAFFLIYYLIGS